MSSSVYKPKTSKRIIFKRAHNYLNYFLSKPLSNSVDSNINKKHSTHKQKNFDYCNINEINLDNKSKHKDIFPVINPIIKKIVFRRKNS